MALAHPALIVRFPSAFVSEFAFDIRGRTSPNRQRRSGFGTGLRRDAVDPGDQVARCEHAALAEAGAALELVAACD
jgi:hypothetical protein